MLLSDLRNINLFENCEEKKLKTLIQIKIVLCLQLQASLMLETFLLR